MRAWDYAYRAARPGPWEQYGRDALRFRKRIEQVQHNILPVLAPDHRAQVYSERFQTDVS